MVRKHPHLAALSLRPSITLFLQWDDSLSSPLFKATNLDYSQNDVRLTLCKDGSYCCGVHNSTCCNRSEGKRIAEVLPTSSPIVALVSSSISNHGTSKATAGVDGATTTATSEKNSPGLPMREAIGIAVGCSIIGVTLVCITTWCLMKRRRPAKPAVMKLKSLSDHEVNSRNLLPVGPSFNILKRVLYRNCTEHPYAKRMVLPSATSCRGKDPLSSSVVMR